MVLNWKLILFVALGGAIGALLRYFLQRVLNGPWGLEFPLGVLSINIMGSFMMGLLIELIARLGFLPAWTQVFLVTGVLGGFTTFSSFTLEFFSLASRNLAYAFFYLFCTIAVAFFGFWLAKQLVTLIFYLIRFGAH